MLQMQCQNPFHKSKTVLRCQTDYVDEDQKGVDGNTKRIRVSHYYNKCDDCDIFESWTDIKGAYHDSCMTGAE